MESAYILLVGYFIAICSVVCGFLWYRSKLISEENNKKPARAAGGGAGGGRLDRMRNRLRQRQRQQPAADNNIANNNADDIMDDDDDDDDDGVDERNLSKADRKALMKQRAKRERAAAREHEIAAREAKTQKQQSKDAARRAKQEERERVETEKAAKAAEEAEKKRLAEEEEYLKWKDAFKVDDVGSAETMTEEESQSLLQDFIDYLKKHKFVELDTAAGEFNLRTQEVVDRIRSLEESGRITGVIDDRGKFIYLSPEELESIGKFMERRGRFTIADMVSEANKIVSL